MLLAEGLITEPQLTEALEEQVVHGGRLGSILVELGHLAPEALAATLSKQVGLPAVEAEELQRLLPSMPQVLTKEQLEQLLGIPLRLDGRTLQIAMVDPGNVVAVDAVQFATQLRLQLRVVAEGLFWNFAEPHLGLERPGFQRGKGKSWARSKPAPAKPQPTTARTAAQPALNRSRPAVQNYPDGPPRLIKPKEAPPPEESDGPPPLELPADMLRDLRATSDLFGPASQVIGGKGAARPGGISTEQLQALRGGEAADHGGLELEAPGLQSFGDGELELEQPSDAGGGLELDEAPGLLVGELLDPGPDAQGEIAPPYVEESDDPAPPYDEGEEAAPPYDEGEEAAPPYVEEDAAEPPPPQDEDDIFASRTMMRPMLAAELFRTAALAEEAEKPPPARSEPPPRRIEPVTLPTKQAGPAKQKAKRVEPVLAPTKQMPALAKLKARTEAAEPATRETPTTPARETPTPARGGLARPGFSGTPTRNVAVDAPPPPPEPEPGDDDFSDAPTGLVERPPPGFFDDPSNLATGVVQAAPEGTFSEEPVDGGAQLVITPFEEILGDLNAATHREEVADALRAYARGRTERMVLLYLRRDAANGFVCEGTGLAQERVVQLSVPLLEPSAFQRARETRLPYIGPPIEGDATDIFQRWLGGAVPTEVVVIPIRIDARVVNLLYLDNGVASLGTAVQLEGLRLSKACAAAYERILARAREGSKG